jgi:hypothetical protein
VVGVAVDRLAQNDRNKERKMKFIGLSLSFCVKDIMDGKVPREHVTQIIPGFCWDGGPPEYFDIYWRKYDRQKVQELLDSMVISCYSIDGSFGHNISKGYWMPEVSNIPLHLRDNSFRMTTQEVMAVLGDHFHKERQCSSTSQTTP